jgi:hypothetical protein
MDEELERLLSFLVAEREIPGLLGDPGSIGVGRAAGDVHLASGKLDEEQY